MKLPTALTKKLLLKAQLKTRFNEEENAAVWKHFKMPAPTLEFRFYSKRKWRIDCAWPEIKLAVEKEGGIYKYGRHNRPSGFIKDMEKYNALTEEGWCLLRYQPKKFDYDQIKRVYEKLLHVEHKL